MVPVPLAGMVLAPAAVVPPPAYQGPLYDVVTAPAIGPQPPVGTPVVAVPAYHYVHQPDRILVVNAAGIAVQALPR